ncbi:hypothetical protein L1887_32553 [Cichorium endivia]|nr:hypothetical protein L1887_32553 [Cichorium endivia]
MGVAKTASAILLIQSATSFSIYNRFYNSRDGIVVVNKDIGTSISMKLPGLPLTPPILEDDPNPHVLINTMDGLEPESLKSIANAVDVGPLVPSSLSSSEGAYFKWLDSKPENSVIYVSFGSTAVLRKAQKKEIQNLKT